MSLNHNFPKLLIAMLILAGLSLLYTITATVPASHAPTLSRVTPHTQLAQVSGSSCTTGDLTCGLVGWWKFDDGSGTTAADSSGSGNTGTLVNGPTWTTGEIGGALSLNGTSQGVKLGYPSSLQLTGGSSVSVSAWVKFSSLPSGSIGLVMDGITATNSCVTPAAVQYLLQDYWGNLSFGVCTSSNTWTTAQGLSPVAGQWYNVVGTYDGTNVKLYVNGELNATTAQTGTLTALGPSYQGASIGYDWNRVGEYFPGVIDDVRVYDRALSATDVQSLYQQASAQSSSSQMSTGTTSTGSASAGSTGSQTTTSTGSTSGTPGNRTFYIAASGSDSNSGTSKSAPWSHAPGMTGCTGTCAATTPQPGDSYIFKGGDTWHADIPSGAWWKWTWAGTSASRIYIGVDKTWYSSSSWTRPVINLDNPTSASAVVSCPHDDTSVNAVDLYAADYTTFDDFEFTGLCWAGTPPFGSASYLSRHGYNITISNNYFHGWTHTASAPDGGVMIVGDTYWNGGYIGINGNVVTGNVFDGSDTDGHSGETIYADAYDFEHNIVRYLSNGVVANNVHTVHDNLFEHINNSYDPADHPNVLETNAEADSDNYVYNNIFRYNQAAVGIWTVAAAGHTDHYFNNVIFDSSSGGDANNDNCWMVSGNTGSTVYFINNTFDAPCRIRNTGNAPFTPPFVGNEYLYNNHLIGYGSLSDLAGTGDNGANATIIERTDTYETEAAANAQGYTASDNYAPANSSGATVNAGTNYTGLSMPGLAADILGVFRPATGPWSTGAYQVNGVAIQQTPGTDIYVSQNGSGTGTSCADPLPISWANATSNWGTSAGQIGPGVTLHLCGTFTGAAGATLLKAQGSGTAGHPITIKFEPGAVAAAPYWAGSNNPGGGAIDISMKSYIILDGGTNGLIENTKNGTGLAYHADSVGVMAEGCEDCEIKNLTIADMYVHTSPSDTSVDQTQVIGIEFSGTNTSVHNNTIHDAGWALGDVYNVGVLLRGGNDISGGDNDSLIYGNDIYNIDHGIWLAGYGVAQTIKVFGNHIHDYANWDTTSNAYHHDGIHAFGWPATSTSFAKINDLWIYDNLFDGDPGNNVTGHVFLEGWNATSDPTPWTDSTGMLHFFNNIGVFPNGRLTYNGIFAIMYAGSNFQIYNNTVVGSSPTAGGSVCLGVASPNPTIKNNVIEGCNVLIGSVTQINNPSQIDYNTYGDCDNSYNCWWDLGPGTGDFTKWLSISGGADAHSTYHSNIDLDSNYRPLAGSPAIGSALNLTGLGTAPLDSDIVGTARPASSAWDAGAYQSGSNQVFTTSGSSAAASGSTSGSSGTTGGTTSGTSGGGGVSTGGGGVGGGGFGGGASINASTNSGTNSPTPNSPTTPCSSSPSVIPASALSLTIGTRGPEVTNLQTFLVIMGYLNRSYITGYFGPLTKAALNSYVASHPSTCRSNIQAPSNNNQTNSNNQISTFTRSLKLGMIGRDVKNLQIFLNQHNFTVSQYGPGSSGHETTYFGPATFRAVIRFQNAYANQILAPYGLSRGTGFFGPSTMKEVNAMRGL